MKKHLRFSLCLVIGVTLLASSCSNKQSFNRQLWSDGNGIEFPYRNNMLDDLLAKRQLKGQKLKQVTDTLGSPDEQKPGRIGYDIEIVYKGFPPSYVKKLYIHFNADSVVTRTEVYEHSNKKKK